MQTVVSDNFIYETIDRATDSFQYTTEFLSEGSQYNLGDIVRIPLPPIQRGFMNCSNSYLKVKTSFTDVTGASLGSTVRLSWIGINALFDQVNILSQGSYIQHYQHYQPMFAVAAACNTSLGAWQQGSITNGFGLRNVGAVYQDHHHVVGQSLGVYDAGGTATQASWSDKDYCPSLMGLLSGTRHLPLTWLNSDAHLELYLTDDIKNVIFNSSAAGTVTGGTATVEISLCAQIDVLSDNSLRKVQQFCDFGQGPVSWSDTQMRASVNTFTTTELNMTPSAMRKTSLITGVRPRKLQKVLQAGFRANTTGAVDPWAMVNPYDNFQVKIGATLYPPRQQENKAEMCAHVLKCFNQSAYTTQNNRIYKEAYVHRFQELANVKSFTELGVAGIDLSQYDNSGGDGLDTAQVSMEVQGDLKLGVKTAVEAISVYTIKVFGVLYSVSPEGDMSVSY